MIMQINRIRPYLLPHFGYDASDAVLWWTQNDVRGHVRQRVLQ